MPVMGRWDLVEGRKVDFWFVVYMVIHVDNYENRTPTEWNL